MIRLIIQVLTMRYRAHVAHMENKMHTRCYLKNLTGRDHFEDFSINEGMAWILRNKVGGWVGGWVWTGLIQLWKVSHGLLL
jgi:hypothetical protein